MAIEAAGSAGFSGFADQRCAAATGIGRRLPVAQQPIGAVADEDIPVAGAADRARDRGQRDAAAARVLTHVSLTVPERTVERLERTPVELPAPFESTANCCYRFRS